MNRTTERELARGLGAVGGAAVAYLLPTVGDAPARPAWSRTIVGAVAGWAVASLVTTP